jgi:hypothetical protein
VHARHGTAAHEAAGRVLASFTLVDGDVPEPPLVHAWLDGVLEADVAERAQRTPEGTAQAQAEGEG